MTKEWLRGYDACFQSMNALGCDTTSIILRMKKIIPSSSKILLVASSANAPYSRFLCFTH
jgi:hypothetical protein